MVSHRPFFSSSSFSPFPVRKRRSFVFFKVIEKAQLKPTEKKVSPEDFQFTKVLGKGNYGKVG